MRERQIERQRDRKRHTYSRRDGNTETVTDPERKRETRDSTS